MTSMIGSTSGPAAGLVAGPPDPPPPNGAGKPEGAWGAILAIAGPRSRVWAAGIPFLVAAAAFLTWSPAAMAAESGVVPPPSHEASEAVRWGLPIGVLAVAVVTVLFAVFGSSLRTLVVGQDNRMSTSKTVAVIWTFVVGVMLLGLVYAKLLNHPQALDATNNSGVIGQYALLFGGPLGAAIVAKGIVNHQVEENQSSKSTAAKPSASDLVSNDAGEADLGDYQYIVFNLVALVYVLGTILHDPTNGLPHIPGVLLGLTSVSAVGYVGKKALMPAGTVIGRLTPEGGPAETAVTITLTGLTPAEQANAQMWVRFGEEDKGSVVTSQVVGGNTNVQVKSPNLGLEKGKAVEVTVSLATGTVVSVGKYAY
jgi:hypothetical protein